MSDDIPLLCPAEHEENRLLIIRSGAEARCRQFSNKFIAQKRRHSLVLDVWPCGEEAPSVQSKCQAA